MHRHFHTPSWGCRHDPLYTGWAYLSITTSYQLLQAGHCLVLILSKCQALIGKRGMNDKQKATLKEALVEIKASGKAKAQEGIEVGAIWQKNVVCLQRSVSGKCSFVSCHQCFIRKYHKEIAEEETSPYANPNCPCFDWPPCPPIIVLSFETRVFLTGFYLLPLGERGKKGKEKKT